MVLGLLVSRGGYPLSYALFNGAQFEGYTMIPIVDDFIQRYNLGSDFVVIADSGLMSEKNVQLLRSAGYKYIIGARIKKESGAMKDLILSTPHEPGVFNDIPYGNGDRLIVGYSEDRARKNEHDRNEGVERLRKRYAKGTLTKADINKRGYDKFLSISSGVSVRIDEDKVWDGLKGIGPTPTFRPTMSTTTTSNSGTWSGHSVSRRERWKSGRCSTSARRG